MHLNDERSKMISSSREKGLQAKQEGDHTNDCNKLIAKAAAASTSSSSRQWAGFRNPRIVRVSRSFGGKDRHSKVCTIRGLRDRRIRLSVPTAIQLYDLQDRLGLTQPSKVIDWLLDITKHDIDKLPPLQMPQGFGTQFHHDHHHHPQQQQMLLPHHQFNTNVASLSPNFFDGGFQSLLSHKEGIDGDDDDDDDDDQTIMAKSKYNWDNIDACNSLRGKGKETVDHQQRGSTNIPFNHSSYYHWEPNSNLSLSTQFGTSSSSHEFMPQNHETSSLNSNASNSFAFPSGSHLFFCPPPTATIMPSLFPTYAPYVSTPPAESSHDPRQQINHFQFLSSTSQLPNSLSITSQVRPFSLNVESSHQDDQENT